MVGWHILTVSKIAAVIASSCITDKSNIISDSPTENVLPSEKEQEASGDATSSSIVCESVPPRPAGMLSRAEEETIAMGNVHDDFVDTALDMSLLVRVAHPFTSLKKDIDWVSAEESMRAGNNVVKKEAARNSFANVHFSETQNKV